MTNEIIENLSLGIACEVVEHLVFEIKSLEASTKSIKLIDDLKELIALKLKNTLNENTWDGVGHE